MFVKNQWFLNQYCDLEGWERVTEPTNRHARASMVWEVGWGEGVGREGKGELIAYELHPSR